MIQETVGEHGWRVRVRSEGLLDNETSPASLALRISAQALADIWDDLMRDRQVENPIGLPQALTKSTPASMISF